MAVASALPVPLASAQFDNPVYVDDSPRAWELFRSARDQTADNAGEAVRLYQELLDEYGQKLIPASETDDHHFLDVRQRVLDDLHAEDTLLDRYRLVQGAEADRLLERNEIERLARTRLLTTAGLDAILRSAQAHLESARFLAALTRLEEAASHPDLAGDRALHAWFMYGCAAHYLDASDPTSRHGSEVALARAALVEAGEEAEAFLAALDALVAEGAGPEIPMGLTVLDRLETSDLASLVSQTIWSVSLDESLIQRRFGEGGLTQPPLAQGFERRRREGELTTAAPTVCGSLVFINEGHTVRALDRITGRDVWSEPFRERSRPDLGDHESDGAGDLNFIAIQGDRLVTLTGHAYADKRSNEGRIVCLATATGELLWSRSLDRLGGDDELEGLFAHGAPVIAEGAVYVLARKVTRQMLTGCYAVALDLGTGEPRWIRHIASSGGRSRGGRPFSTLVHEDGDLYAATSIGAVCRVEAASGTIRWLRRYNVPVREHVPVQRPWEISAPIVLADRVITLTPDQLRVVVLDRATGDELLGFEAGSHERWNAPAYLVHSAPFVLAVGADVRAFHEDSLERPIWSLAASAVAPARAARAANEAARDEGAPAPLDGAAQLAGEEPPLDDAQPLIDDEPQPAGAPPDGDGAPRLELAGRVQAVDEGLLVPTADDLLLVEPASGRILHRLALDAPGNPLAVGSQVLVAAADSLDVYMSLGRAEEILRSRIAASTDDAQAPMALLQLGIRVGRLDLALEAAALTQGVLARAPDGLARDRARQELFDLLIGIHSMGLATSARESESLHAAIGQVAESATQRVDHLLAWGDSLVERDPARAVETWQRVLFDPTLAGTMRSELELLRPASAWAIDRLGALLDSRGFDLYAPLDADAALALARLDAVADPQARAEALVTMAMEFPFAGAGLEAAIRGAESLRSRGDLRGALAALAAAYHLAPRRDRAERLLGRFAEVCEEMSGKASAAAVLRRATVAWDLSSLETSSGSRAVTEWLATIAPPTARTQRPRVGDGRGGATILDGQLVPPAPGATLASPVAHALLVEGDQLRLALPDADRPLWTTTIDGPAPRLLSRSDEEILLLVGLLGGTRVISLDAASGRERWRTAPMEEVLDAPFGLDRGIVDQMPDGLPFDPGEVLVRIDDELVTLVWRTGGVAVFGRSAGDLRFTVESTLEQVHLVLAHPFGLVLAGRDREVDPQSGESELLPRVVVIDLAHEGRVLHRSRPQSRSGIIWMGADALGTLLCATADGVEAIDLLRGRRRWTNAAFDVRETRRGSLGTAHAIVESRTSTLLSLQLDDGDLSTPFDTSVRGDWDSLALGDILWLGDDAIFACYSRRVIRYDAAGQVRAADAVSDPRDYRAIVPGDARLVVLSLSDSTQVPVDGGRRRQWTYRIYVLSEECRVEGEPIELPPLTSRVRDVALIDDWLLLSTDVKTVAIPLARGERHRGA